MTSDVIDAQHASFEMLAEQLLGSSLAQLAMEPEQYAQVKAAQQAQAQQVINQVTQSAEATIISVDTTLAKLQAEIDTMGGLLDPNARTNNGNAATNSNTHTNANTAIGNTNSSTNQGNVNVRNSTVAVNNGVNTNSQQSNANSNSNVNQSQPSKAQRWNAQQQGQATWSTKNNNAISQPNNLPSPDQGDEENPLLGMTHIGLGLTSIGLGFGEFSNVIGDKWVGNNYKLYDINSRFFGNQHTGSKLAAVEAADAFRTGGAIAFTADAGLSTVEGAIASYNGNSLAADKDALDVFMAGVGFILGTPEALAAASLYFAVDKVIGWNNVGAVVQTAYNVDEEQLNEQLNNMDINYKGSSF